MNNDIGSFLGEFDGVDSAWRSTLSAIREHGNQVPGSTDPLSIGSTFGRRPRAYRELLGASFSIQNPRNRLTRSRVREINHAFLFANVIWTAIGSNELARIAFYNSRGREFSDDNVTLPAAIGTRIFQSAIGDQFSACAAILKRDASTRRAVVSVYSTADVGSVHRDCSCVLAMQFLCRENELHCVVSMRSQSAAMIFPYDAFLLSMLHESMAVQTDMLLGKLIFQYGSLHYYLDESQLAEQILAESPDSPPIMPPMSTPLSRISEALGIAEEEIRVKGKFNKRGDIDGYWHTFLTALQHSIQSRNAPKFHTLPASLSSSWYASVSHT